MKTKTVKRKQTKVWQRCDWFALCENTATGTTPHPILGPVNTCKRCHDKFHDTPQGLLNPPGHRYNGVEYVEI